MSQTIKAFKKYFLCVKLNMPRVVQNCTTTQLPPPKMGLTSNDTDKYFRSAFDWTIMITDNLTNNFGYS